MHMHITISAIFVSTTLFGIGIFVYLRHRRVTEELRRRFYIEEQQNKRRRMNSAD